MSIYIAHRCKKRLWCTQCAEYQYWSKRHVFSVRRKQSIACPIHATCLRTSSMSLVQWQRRCDGCTYRAETMEQRVDGGWRNEDAVVQQQLEQPVYTAQTDNPVPGRVAMQALVHRHPKLVCDSICHIEPMQLRVKQVCQAMVVLRAAHNSRCSIHDPLQLVGNRLWCCGQQQIAIVLPGRNKGVNQYGCRFVVEWSANSSKLS